MMAQPSGAAPRFKPWQAIVLLIGGGTAVYLNSLTAPFVFDDLSAIVSNGSIRTLWPPWTALSPPTGGSLTVEGRPVLNLSLALNYALGGLDVRGYHTVNIAIHVLAALALFGVVRQTFLTPRLAPRLGPAATLLACAVALIWEAHPLQTESVTYVVQRAESLMGLFYLLTMYAFVRYAAAQPGNQRHARCVWLPIAVTACWLGMATKEVMASAPVMVLLYDRTFIAGSFRRIWERRRLPYGLLGGSWILLTSLIASGGGNRSGIFGFGLGASWWEYWLTQCIAIVHYLRLAIWPHPLVFEYGVFSVADPMRVVLPGLLLLAFVTGTVMGLRRNAVLGFLGFWFFALLAPTSIVPSTTQMIVEHRMYLSLAAVVSLLVGSSYIALERLNRTSVGSTSERPGRLFVAAWMAIAIAFGGLTLRRNEDYKSAIDLWRDTVAKRPENFLAHHLLGTALEEAGEFDAGVAHYREALQLEPRFFRSHASLGALFLRTGRRNEADQHFLAALKLQPDNPELHEYRGILLTQDKRFHEAIVHLEKALTLEPEREVTRYNLAHALASAGRHAEAVFQYRKVVHARPDFVEGHYNLANALVAIGEQTDALASYETALRFQPDYAKAHNNIANLLASRGRIAKAIDHYFAALAANPDSAEAHHNLGTALFEAGRLNESASHYEEALRLNPGLRAAQERLAAVRARQAGQTRPASAIPASR
jgi:tetratricopeptide (TPR) repeat protein